MTTLYQTFCFWILIKRVVHGTMITDCFNIQTTFVKFKVQVHVFDEIDQEARTTSKTFCVFTCICLSNSVRLSLFVCTYIINSVCVYKCSCLFICLFVSVFSKTELHHYGR